MLYSGASLRTKPLFWFNAIFDGRSANCVRVGRGVFV